jgi:hypothetical protein
LIGGATSSSSVKSGRTLSSVISFGKISDSGRVVATGDPPFFQRTPNVDRRGTLAKVPVAVEPRAGFSAAQQVG